MKETTIKLLMIFFIITIIIISGCSSGPVDRLQNQQRDRQFQPDGFMNLTEEERQQMFEERQQKAIEQCQGKNEGDDCVFETPRGEMNGICKILDENLVCTTEIPMRQR